MFKVVAPLAAACVLLSGCAAAGLARVDSAGSPVQSVKALQAVDLPTALNPAGVTIPGPIQRCINANAKPSTLPGDACSGVSKPGSPRWTLLNKLGLGDTTDDRDRSQAIVLERLRLEAALQAFYSADYTGSKEERRNRVLQRLIAASDTNCAIFGETLFGVQSTLNFTLGGAATALGGAGSIVTNGNTARLLSGLSAISSGFRAEMNEDYFRKLWIEAVLKGIENARSEMRDNFKTRRTESISTYPVEEAIADALRYNGACSLVSGLKEVNEAVNIADDPAGLRAFRDTYARAGFDASFHVEADSKVLRSDRLFYPTGPAQASMGLRQVADDLADLKIAHDKALEAIEKAPMAEKTAATDEINAAYGMVYPATTATLTKTYVAELNTRATDYSTRVTELAAADKPEVQAQTRKLMQANDAASEVIVRSARELIAAARSRMDAAVAKATTPKTPEPAKTS